MFSLFLVLLVALGESLPVRGVIAAAEVIDRILAVVNGEVITLSDVRAAQRFGLVPADVSTDPVNAALQRLIDRRLMVAEVDRYAPPEPPAASIDAALDAVRAGSKDGAELEAALTRYGLSPEELRRFVRDTLRLDAYLQQRFAAMAQPSDDETERYYKEHPEEFSANGRVRPLDEVREQARGRAIEARRSAFVREWVDGLRRRASLVVLYLPGR